METEIKVAGHVIGPDRPCFIIAEAGSNHNRDFNTALGMIDIATAAGADAVKFQTYSAESLYSKKTPTMQYLKNGKLLKEGETVWDMIKRVEMPREWHHDLARHCAKKGVIFLSTPFDLQAVKELEAVHVAAYKIASFEITHIPLLRAAARTGKPVILSTGMADLSDIELALETIYGEGNTTVALLHCAISYPPKYEDLNLRAMDTMRQAFGVPVGFSDHTLGIISDVAAVARGASIIEKHFTLNRSMPGPDHAFSLEPGELKSMCEAIRNTEKSLGSNVKKHTEAEKEMHSLARRSLVAARDIPAGTAITEDMLDVKRPGFGIHSKYMSIVVGRVAKKAIEQDDILTWDMF
ncbi:MAG: N-acetylneuraminate synthase [bacterium]